MGGLQQKIQQTDALKDWIYLYAVNHDASSIITSSSQQQPESSNTVTALTWGVFPNREIVQPTIFDSYTYCHVWYDEAFSLWKSMWMNLYEYGSVSWNLIND